MEGWVWNLVDKSYGSYEIEFYILLLQSQENISDLAYWLSTSSTLLYLLQSSLKATNTSTVASNRNRASPATLFGRMAYVCFLPKFFGYETDFICLNFSTKYRSFQGLRSSSVGMGISSGYSGMVGKTNNQSKVEAKYPALLFKQHLAACIEKLFGMIRDNLKKEISPFLHLCIQVKTKILLSKQEKMKRKRKRLLTSFSLFDNILNEH